MQIFQIHELLENSPGLTVTLIPGYGSGYTDDQQEFINGHVMDMVGRLRQLDPSVKIVISSMDTNTSIREAEIKTVSLALTSDILLYVTPTCVSIAKWRRFHDRVGSTVGS
ncbi:hypothetical protein AH04_278 [Erwinia phage AH04]|uniref:Uncharacterized protein n=1 Tax=Erwinia phage AH04 TaxID=2869569 RepID=A0AAE7X161_9CAUD|nr:hypothetical protein PQC02_gp036 [Erwinia phage AH04]QZA70751.1 hypothetical protein AH04_278 [Erwinia phage AH04]